MTIPGAYCLKASTQGTGLEELMEFHWMPLTEINVANTAPVSFSASTTGLLRFATQL